MEKKRVAIILRSAVTLGEGAMRRIPYHATRSCARRYAASQDDVQRFIYHSAWIWLAFFVLLNAWVSEDAYITLRVLDNFFHGYGLRWNINERVQVYTHPLWLLLHIPINIFLSNLFLTNVILSTLTMMGAVFLTLNTVRKPLLITLSCFFLPIMASKALRDYSTSGLENPLSYLLFALFGYILLKKYGHPKFWLYCSLTVALALLNRLDMIIFYAPTLVWLAWHRFHEIRWRQILIGALPLLAWFAFAFLYYGFLFPNTKYAKLNTGIETYRYIRQGLIYAKYTLLTDTATGLAILSSLVFIALAMLKKNLPILPLCLALGIYFDVLYVIYIGGDYMVGRFWSYPAFVAVWLAYVYMPDNINPKAIYALIALLLLVGAPLPTSSYLRKYCLDACGMNPNPMIDAKWMFNGEQFIPKLSPFTINTDAHHKFVGWAEALAKKAPGHVEKAHFIGMLGYYAGPGNILIDELALADPLLARLPVPPNNNWFFSGHFQRPIPAGYIDAVKTGSTEKMDPSLALYYEKLRLITSGDLTDPERIKTIIAFNLGTYDHWKRDYLLCTVW